jgi:hypothetical protein
VIVVVDPAQIVEGEMAGERGRLRTDAFHQAAIAADGIDVIVEEIETWLVVTAGEPFAGSFGRPCLLSRCSLSGFGSCCCCWR